MIDDFAVFATSGVVLWRKSFVKVRGDPVARLVQTVLLEDRAALSELVADGYTVRWVLANEVGLVFALVYQTSLPPAYAGDLLSAVRGDFVRRYAERLQDTTDDDYGTFSPHFERLLTAAEERSLNRAMAARKARPAAAAAAAAAAATASAAGSRAAKRASGGAKADAKDEGSDESTSAEEDPEELMRRNREAFFRKRAGSGKKKDKGSAVAPAAPATNGKGKKPKRGSGKDTEEDIAALDFSTDKPTGDEASEAELRRFKEQFLEAQPNTAYTVIQDGDELDANAAAGVDTPAASSGVVGFFKGLAGMKDLTRADLEPALCNFRDALIGKNVAKDIADRLIDSVATSLEGKRMESMTTVASTVRKALDEALTRILTPRQSVDILAEIAAKMGSGRPYVISFCGVNGVGKSTSLAKICYYLLKNGHTVMIAACDTFRAGAVEQLRTHVRCLGDGVELFDRGYGKDAAAVANDAIRRAKELKYDVVLVDTAGRMQDNEPLMRALSKLVEVNQPDRLFFVGEALVGNDAVDQLTKFNAALADHQKSSRPRLIDGIVLTKFDTIDDKVGAAVSMVYTTGQPIVFVGVGQTYMDLRKVNTRSLVKALLQ